ncbi:MAG: oxygen-independent coproporphyrinogen III oxidase, partial [Planctomycetes bacterium]|nr:oxygen-independent coproporphyrinogen III oxidase [Planctomycetota bacterium]
LALYVHIPFCERLCKFCACNREILSRKVGGAAERVERYLSALAHDLRTLAGSIDSDRPLRQVHWGGGSPTYLTAEQIERIHAIIVETFNLADDAEVAMEIDPRGVSPDKLAALRRMGFNRVSMGVQDFDARTQEHVHRVQPVEMVREVVDTCRDLAFDSVNFDLIYGMPYQTPDTIRHTIQQCIALAPDRIAYYHYAQIPEKIANQRGIHHDAMPDSQTKLVMFLSAVVLFEAAGYEFVGLDHFAKSDEILTRAVENHTVHRTFQGMTTGAALDLIGMGASSISTLHEIGFLHNIRNPDEYADAIESGTEVSQRGMRLSHDDVIRQTLINDLYSHGAIVPGDLEAQFDIVFCEYFADEIERLRTLEADGLIEIDDQLNIQLAFPLGRVLMRNVAAVFDAYLSGDAFRTGELHLYSVNA